MQRWKCKDCERDYLGIPWMQVGGGWSTCHHCGGELESYEVPDPPLPPLYHIVAVANTTVRGNDEEEAKRSFMNAAETLDEDEWTFILVHKEQ